MVNNYSRKHTRFGRLKAICFHANNEERYAKKAVTNWLELGYVLLYYTVVWAARLTRLNRADKIKLSLIFPKDFVVEIIIKLYVDYKHLQ